MDFKGVVKAVCPSGKADLIEGFAAELARSGVDHGLTPENGLRLAHFIAQCAAESDGFRTFVEYASGKAYEGRKDLGNTRKGDGPAFKGRGPLQLTGRANYQRFSEMLGLDLVKDPDTAARPDIGAKVAIAYWDAKNLSVLADRDDLHAVTRRINGGLNGLAQRGAYLERAKAALGLGDDPASAVSEPAPQGKVKALQERLKALGYHSVGVADGHLGPNTVGALSAFQAEHGLPVTGTIDADTESALWSAEPRPIHDDRANGVPEGSSILATASKLKNGAVVVGGGGGALIESIPDPGQALDKAEQVRGYLDRARALLEPLASLKAFVLAHPGLLMIVVGAAVFIGAHVIHSSRLSDYRSGKTP